MTQELNNNLIERAVVGDIFRRRASTSKEKIALVENRDGKEIRLSYGELNQKLNQFARALRNAEIRQGDRVGLLGLNSTEYFISLYGCAKAGITVVPINPGLSPKDVAYILDHAEVKALVVDDQLVAISDAIRKDLPNLELLVGISATGQTVRSPYIDFEEFISQGSPDEVEDVIIRDRDVFEILYTSGTTSLPKGVMVAHLSTFIMSLTNPIEMNMGLNTVTCTVLPMFHCAQQTFALSALHLGGKVVIFRAFDPGLLLDAIERERIQMMLCLPAMYRAMLDHPKIKSVDLSSLKTGVYAMTPMDRRTLEEAIETFGADFLLGTGQTEFFPSTNTFRSEWQLKKMGNYWGESALTLDTAIMDSGGDLLPQGETGEIVWRGPAVMNCYLKNEEATVESRAFGWHHSGDLGYFDEDNLLVFVDRKKDMIKTGGENVPSIKVERALLSDHRIMSAAVVGLPHPHWTEAVTAFVVKQENADLDEQDVIDLCKRELGKFEIPKRVVFIDEMPLTSTGKIRKNILRENNTEVYQS
ncbi:acyl-CoA synthetase [Desulfosarcina alkanivorans]|uniref:Acyl-CoA synthetase n=1 Tax=Desulfosarcina alkanivorans TaxID=571177 RepID=A0A5K7YLQ7_9BACT|nr:AMP-binding protein [Desulfosarcina alkanivorans]BBO69758.1 acyl-CoA synthetase [Desulfosarcina alkanivorans]